jgi:simple sugar transport system substrate-binding protein
VGDDPTTIESKVSAYLRQNPKTEAVLALGPTSAHPTIKALEKNGLKGKIWFATFDLSDQISKGIKDGSIQFGIDQQPYLQGYIPVAVLATMKAKKTTDVASVVAAIKANEKTKARFVTKENIGKVEKFAGQYR